MEIGSNDQISIQGPTNKDLEAIRFEVGTVIEASKIKADFGSYQLSSIPDIADSITPQELIQKKFIFFTNEEEQTVKGHKNECRIMLPWTYEQNKKFPIGVSSSSPNGTRITYETPEGSVFDTPPNIQIHSNLETLSKSDKTIYKIAPFLNFDKSTGILQVFIFSCYYYSLMITGQKIAQSGVKGLSLRPFPDL